MHSLEQPLFSGPPNTMQSETSITSTTSGEMTPPHQITNSGSNNNRRNSFGLSSAPSYYQTPPQRRRSSASFHPVPVFQYVPPAGMGRKGYARWIGSSQWDLKDECRAPCEETSYFCCACVCPICAAFQQRQQLLLHNSQNYTCCGGIFCDDECGAGVSSWICLLCEVTLCLPISVHANRYILQQHYHLEQTWCDTISTKTASWLELCGTSVGSWAPWCTFACAIPCLLSQQKREIEANQYPKTLRSLRRSSSNVRPSV
eukprot:PhF_6_TR25790/c0_g1_i1/m.36380